MQQASSQALMLTVAEALVLQAPQKAQGRAALKLTMMDLLARLALSLHQEVTKGRLGMTRKTEYLRLDPGAAARFQQYPHVRAVIETIAEAGKPGTEPTTAASGGSDGDERELEQQDGSPDADTSFDAFDVGDWSFDSFDSLDTSLDAFDSSFDSSADSGGDGGDGGGGDGGGSD